MFFKKPLLGLDLGSSSIKIANLKVSGKKAVLNDLVILPLAHGAVEAGDVVNPDLVATCIQQGIEKKSYSKGQAAVGMFGSSVVVKKISMPKMDKKIVSEQLRWEAEQYIPFSIDEAVFDFHILSTEGGRETMDVLLVAARQEHLFRYFEALEGAGLSCNVVDVNGIALANCFEFNYGKVPNVIALVNIGASVSNLVIMEAGNVSFSRDIPFGGFLYDSEIGRELGINPMEAEGLKLGVSYNQETPQEVLSAIQYVNESVSQEINNSFDFYSSTSANGKVSQIFISGGAAQTPGLIEKIQETTQVPCELLDPFQKIEINKKKFSAEFIDQIKLFAPVSLGLGLRNLG